ncbi:MAG: 2-succinyl-5-enolpyruvyl-6-hydroxy-3-cyclohexene-1-carboxylate synthase [Bacteroidales bacterium]|nr:2-succinyl-5-enolpyruvyl-6-hydroxy-3-cyclohexene-1-carboxylate synthase [Bacteroidales bacterium]
MEQYYTDEKNVQILIALLKAHGVKHIIVSPGSTNVTFVGSIQQDPYFEIFSCVDERSAAYMACGMAAELNEPVALSCTGATASRNYFSALTEAYYRKLPIVAITSTQDNSRLGHLYPQAIDRSLQPADVVKISVYLQNVKDAQDEYDCMIKANKALLELHHHGEGPVHINLATNYCQTFTTKNLPAVNVIRRYTIEDELPPLPQGKIAIYVGSHLRWDEHLTMQVDAFCERHHAVVFSDPTANYNGKYGITYWLAARQRHKDENRNPDLLIHIGNMSDMWSTVAPKNVWRVAEDGEVTDCYKQLRNVFEMKETTFFQYYAKQPSAGMDKDYHVKCREQAGRIKSAIPELPFSQIWMANYLHDKRFPYSVWHYGILSPLRSWGFFETPGNVETYCNQGGFGIDGNMSSLIGASLVNPNKIFFGVVGDLSFFYDLNSLGNRHIGSNLRILLVNNSVGAEFHLFTQLNSICVNDVDKYISAGGHFGQKSKTLVRDYVQALGFEYLTASNKDDFINEAKSFMDTSIREKPVVFEVFTDVADENEALYILHNLDKSSVSDTKQKVRNLLHGGGHFDTSGEEISTFSKEHKALNLDGFLVEKFGIHFSQIRHVLSGIKSQICLELGFMREICLFWQLTRRYNASNHTDEDME